MHTTSRSELPRPKNLLPQSPSTTLGGGGWRQPQANTDLLSPANLPHEILLHIFKFLLTRTTGHSYLRSSLMVCRSWCLCGVELLWHRPAFFHLSSLVKLIQTIRSPEQTFPYVTFIRRLNFSGIATELPDQLFGFMSKCSRLERLAIAECSELSDQALSSTLASLNNLVSIDLTNVKNLTDGTLEVMARSCKRLQGVNFTNCKKITSRGVAALGENCPLLRRVKFCSCELLGDEGVLPLIMGCPMLLEVDFFNCPVVSDRAVRQIWISSSHVRELRLANCGPLTDAGFPAPARMLTSSAAALDLSPSVSTRLATPNVDHLNSAVGQHGSESAPTSRGASPVGAMRESSPGLGHDRLSSTASRGYAEHMSLSVPLKPPKSFEHLRILDLTNCNTISDDAIEGIISNAPRIRNLGLSKCTRLTDETVYSISKLGKNLQYLHLGHVSNITDRGVRHLVDHCTRIRYLDLANCTQLTDLSVMELATKLPKLKRIGLVRVHLITDNALYALVERHLNLQRVHLSYCTKISVAAVFWLLERLPKVTHISLTGVTAFQRPELQAMCRPPPEEFSATQRESFCVYSGHGVVELHHYLRSVYSSEASARQFMNQSGELSAEDFRAVHLMRQLGERSRNERRWRYQRYEAPDTSRVTNEPGAGTIRWHGDQTRASLAQQCGSYSHAIPFAASSTFPLAHITTSSTLRYPPELNEHFNGAGGSTTLANAERREEEDFPLAPEDWRDGHVNQTAHGWPAGVSSPDFAQMDPRVWSAPTLPAHSAVQRQSAPSLPTDPGAPQPPPIRHPLESSRSDGIGASGLPSNPVNLGPYHYAGVGDHASVRARGGASFALPMVGAPYSHTGVSDARLSPHAPNVSATLTPPLMVPGPSGRLEPRSGSTLLADHAETPLPTQPRFVNPAALLYGQHQEPVHSRGAGGTAAVGSSSRSSSSSAQAYGVPTSDSSGGTFFPPPPTAMARSAAASGGPSSGLEAANASGRHGQAGNGVGIVREPSQVRSMFEDQRRAMANMNRERDAVARDFQRRVHEAARAQQAGPTGSQNDPREAATSSSAAVGESARNTSPMRLDEEEAAGDESDDKFVDAVGDASMSANASSSSQLNGLSNGVQPRGLETSQQGAETETEDGSGPARLAHVREQRLRMLGEQP